MNDDSLILNRIIKILAALSLLTIFICLSITIYRYCFETFYDFQTQEPAKITTLMHYADIVDSGETIEYSIDIKKPLDKATF